MHVRHSRIQHGVGQGSFHSATVEFSLAPNVEHRFDYIYDCGALKYWREAPGLLYALSRVSLDKRGAGGSKAILDLLILSHFDSDHMNGAKKLVNRYSVDRIVLPYLGIQELALVIANQAEMIDGDTIRQLHALTHGDDKFWGCPVTMVQTGPRQSEGRPGQADPRPVLETGELPAAQEFPHRVSVFLESTDARPDRVMSDEDNLIVRALSSQPDDAWKLRFWNRGMAARLGELILQHLAEVTFPVEALSDRVNGAQAIIAWLDFKPVKAPRKRAQTSVKSVKEPSHRDLALEAYRKAITEFAPTWQNEASGDSLANFLSLGLYSGPRFGSHDWQQAFHTPYPQGHWTCGNCNALHWREDEVLPGWIGTGDAPLGEPGIWQDFELHYSLELPQVQTVVVPHHGAAPQASTRFYNPKLNHREGMTAVVSYGVRNSYGHPHPSVVAGVAYAGAQLVHVTEDTRLGFQEIYSFWRWR